ncbi:MAG: tRNA dihydrouridine synthase DusB [Candidatus Paraimprobicoccus trichonymphae]|uniref:tRNA-dihydrouridine synthase n=1 Tax=Candidatus Paraimprobicoccus trichonymphae TaxID=3033793 RepID=A0AA48I0E6_9FIRM|nr:MAG: tRNA dihydrouridine synthase DusB [Candidatus Paraimprobicoccus trichonymphae]
MNNFKKFGKTILAPMAGITDMAFREICAELGASYFTSEMVSAKAMVYKNYKTLDLIKSSDKENFFVVQLFGNEPEIFREAVIILKNLYNINLININMGCPAKKIVKTGAGAALLLNPNLCGKIVKSITDLKNIDLTVKIRSGWDSNNITAAEIAKQSEFFGANAIIVHGRTRSQMYSGKVDLEIIKKVKSSVKIPVIGNGDVNSIKSAVNMLNYTKCDSLAIGRGALGNPWIFNQINEFLEKNVVSEPISIEEKVKTLKKHIYKLFKYKPEKTAINDSKKNICYYLKNFKNASKFKSEVFLTKNKNQIIDFVENLIKIYSQKIES